ncbi:hypothetical protein Tco_1072417 [Tanacetum coccineum]
MYLFERYMKKLKNYVRNKAKPEGSISEGYVAEEALTFSSYYFRDVITKFNYPDCNVDCPPATCQFQVFRSICKSIGKRSFIWLDHQELKKVIWYVLHNSPEINMYRAKFKSEIHNQDMKEEFPGWFGSQSFKDDQYILGTQAKQVFYLKDMARRPPDLKVVQDVNLKKFSNGGVIMVEDDHDVIHFDNSFDLALSTSLDDLDFATLNIDGQSMDIGTPSDIIDVDEDDDLIDDEDTLPHDLVDSVNEDLANDDDDDVAVVYSSEEED